MDLEVALRVVVGGAHEDLLSAHLPAQVARQRDAVVERMAFRSDDRDLCFGVGLSQVLCARLPGDAVAEDDVPTSQRRNE